MKICVLALLMASCQTAKGQDDFLMKELPQTTTSSEYAELYYDSDDGYKLTSITNSDDYSGIGFYPMEKQETDHNGNMYLRGIGLSYSEAISMKDYQFGAYIKKHSKRGEFLRILELGSGRGGFTRYIAKELEKFGILKKIVAGNISQRENEYNVQKASEEGIDQEKMEVIYLNFDDLSSIESDAYDVVISNEAFYHSSDHAKLFSELHRVLDKQGVLIFSDILQSAKASTEQGKDSVLQKIYDELKIDGFGTQHLYKSLLKTSGLTELYNFQHTRRMQRHYGNIKYNMLEKKEQLLGPDGISPDFFNSQLELIDKWVEAIKQDKIGWEWFIYKKESGDILKPKGLPRQAEL